MSGQEIARRVADKLQGRLKYRCYNCEWQSDNIYETLGLTNINERVEPGELFPTGECPECYAAIPCPDEDIPLYTINAIVEILRDRGWQIREPAQ